MSLAIANLEIPVTRQRIDLNQYELVYIVLSRKLKMVRLFEHVIQITFYLYSDTI